MPNLGDSYVINQSINSLYTGATVGGVRGLTSASASQGHSVTDTGRFIAFCRPEGGTAVQSKLVAGFEGVTVGQL